MGYAKSINLIFFFAVLVKSLNVFIMNGLGREGIFRDIS